MIFEASPRHKALDLGNEPIKVDAFQQPQSQLARLDLN